MKYFKRDDGALQAERRATGRVRIDCAAQLRLPSGDRAGRMSNISETGVRLELDRPPPEGATVMLQWRTHEYFCKVIWANEDSCGVAFERPLPREVFLETTGQSDEPGGPVANPRNISLGKKRSRMQFSS